MRGEGLRRRRSKSRSYSSSNRVFRISSQLFLSSRSKSKTSHS